MNEEIHNTHVTCVTPDPDSAWRLQVLLNGLMLEVYCFTATQALTPGLMILDLTIEIETTDRWLDVDTDVEPERIRPKRTQTEVPSQ